MRVKLHMRDINLSKLYKNHKAHCKIINKLQDNNYTKSNFKKHAYKHIPSKNKNYLLVIDKKENLSL